MPRKSYKELQHDLLECQRTIGDLKLNRAYNAVRREAAPFEMAHLTAPARTLVLVEILSPAPDTSIRRALHSRHKDALAVIHWEGLQFVIVLGDSSLEFVDRLYPVLKNEGLQAAVASIPYSGDIEKDARIAQAITQAHKEGYLA